MVNCRPRWSATNVVLLEEMKVMNIIKATIEYRKIWTTGEQYDEIENATLLVRVTEFSEPVSGRNRYDLLLYSYCLFEFKFAKTSSPKMDIGLIF